MLFLYNFVFLIFFQVIFSDESSFEVNIASSRFVRVGKEPLSSNHVIQRAKHPQKVMIWGSMSHAGMGRIYVVEGYMNSSQYMKVLRSRLIPQMNAWGRESAIFQQDSAPCHTSRIVKQFFNDHSINVLPWPGNSPDMNPIETIWAILKRRLQQTTFTSKPALINAILDYTTRDTDFKRQLDLTCKRLIESMPERVRHLKKAKGGHTRF